MGAEGLLLAGQQVQLAPAGGAIGVVAHVAAPWHSLGQILVVLGAGEAASFEEVIVAGAGKGREQTPWSHRVDEEFVGTSMIAQGSSLLVLRRLGSCGGK